MNIFKRKKITLEVNMENGNSIDSRRISGARIKMRIKVAPQSSGTRVSLKIYGLSEDLQQQMTVLQNGFVTSYKNQIIVSAGDEDGESVVFKGFIFTAWVNNSSAPETYLDVIAFSDLTSLYKQIQPTTFKGTVAISDIVSAICTQFDTPKTLKNLGVTGNLTDQYVYGTPATQLDAIAQAGDFSYSTDDGIYLKIWPRGKGIDQDVAVRVSPETGLIGYPVHNDKGITFKSFFNSNFRVIGVVDIQSSDRSANGYWVASSVEHELDTYSKNGKWQTTVHANRQGLSQQDVNPANGQIMTGRFPVVS